MPLNAMMKVINLFLLLLFTTVSYAENNAGDPLQRFLNNMQTLEANFTQILVDDQGMKLESSRGVVFLSRPDKFRWNYTHPYIQTIVSNGKSLWFYDEDLEQVTIRDISLSMKNTPVAILNRYEDIEVQFIITDMGAIEEFDWVELIPRDLENQYESIRLGFDKDKLGMMVMLDNFGQITRIDFTEETINKSMKDSLFNFESPQGIDIIDDRGSNN